MHYQPPSLDGGGNINGLRGNKMHAEISRSTIPASHINGCGGGKTALHPFLPLRPRRHIFSHKLLKRQPLLRGAFDEPLQVVQNFIGPLSRKSEVRS